MKIEAKKETTSKFLKAIDSYMIAIVYSLSIVYSANKHDYFETKNM